MFAKEAENTSEKMAPTKDGSAPPKLRPVKVVGYVPYTIRLRTLQLVTSVGYEKWTDAVLYKLRTAVYPSKLAPIGLKLCQKAFQAIISDISFFDAPK